MQVLSFILARALGQQHHTQVTQQHRIIFFVNGFEIRLILSHLSENLNPKPQVKIVSNTMSELEPKFGFRVASRNSKNLPITAAIRCGDLREIGKLLATKGKLGGPRAGRRRAAAAAAVAAVAAAAAALCNARWW